MRIIACSFYACAGRVSISIFNRDDDLGPLCTKTRPSRLRLGDLGDTILRSLASRIPDHIMIMVRQENSRMAKSNSVELAAEIVAAFVSNNPLPKGELPALIHAVHSAVERLAAGPDSAPPQVEAKTPVVSIRKSITPDFLICLDDGKRFKSLRRHLAGLGLTPQQYREKWNLPSDYPMVAPNYAAQRSALAKKIGFGQTRGKAGARNE